MVVYGGKRSMKLSNRSKKSTRRKTRSRRGGVNSKKTRSRKGGVKNRRGRKSRKGGRMNAALMSASSRGSHSTSKSSSNGMVQRSNNKGSSETMEIVGWMDEKTVKFLKLTNNAAVVLKTLSGPPYDLGPYLVEIKKVDDLLTRNSGERFNKGGNKGDQMDANIDNLIGLVYNLPDAIWENSASKPSQTKDELVDNIIRYTTRKAIVRGASYNGKLWKSPVEIPASTMHTDENGNFVWAGTRTGIGLNEDLMNRYKKLNEAK